MMKKLLVSLLGVAMCMTIFTACNTTTATVDASDSQAENPKVPTDAIIVKFGNAGAIGEPAAETSQYFCDLATERLGGRYVFDFYPAEQLGNEATMLENLQVGLQEGVMTSLDTLATYSPDLNILSMAFAFDSADAMLAYLNSDLGDSIWADLDSQGIHVINYSGLKNPRIFFCKWAINSPEDMKGMLFRIPNLPIFEKNARAMGATPTIISWSEYPFALMQGTVDGGECAKEAYRSAGFYESAKYVAEVDYAYPVEEISFSTQFWNSLTAEDQAIIEACAEEAATRHTANISSQWEQDKEFLINEGGVTFCDIDKQAFIDAAASLGQELQTSGFFATENLYDLTRQFNG
ncbi:MAG: TRAP transporter substrate-binding protein [Candidatus Fimivivens sp.]